MKKSLLFFVLFSPFLTFAQICTKYAVYPDTVEINTATVFNVQEVTGSTIPPELWVCNWIDFENDGTHECTAVNSCQFTFSTGGWHAVAFEITEPFLSNTAVCTSYVYVKSCGTGPVLATADATADSVVRCAGSQVALSLNAPSAQFCYGSWEYLWFDGLKYYDGTGFNATVEVWNVAYQNITTGNINSNTIFKGKIRCSDAYGCTDSSSVLVKVQNVGIFTLTGGGAYCSGNTGTNDTLSGSQTGVSYQLMKDGSNEGVAIDGTGGILVWNNLTAGTYTVAAAYIAVPHCTAAMNGSVVISENPTPVVEQISNISVCPGSTINIGDFVSNPTGATFEWTNSNTAIGIAAGGSGNIASWTAPANSTGTNIVSTIEVIPSLNGCQGSPMTFTVAIKPSPTVIQKPDIYVCPGSTINIGSFVSMPAGATFEWTNSNTSIGLAASGSGNIPSWTAPVNSTDADIVSTITVTPSLNGCTGIPMSFTVTIKPTPVVTPITNIEVCPGSQIVIPCFTSIPSGATFDWTNTNVAIGLPASGTGCIPSWTAPANITGTNIVSTIEVIPSLNGCHGPPMTFTITIKPSPAVIQKPDIYVCPGSTINIGSFVSMPAGATFEWTNSNTSIGLAASGSGNIASWTAPANNTCVNITATITVTSTLNDCQGTPMSFTVTIYPSPFVGQLTNIIVCPGSLINIGAFTSCPGATFSWTNSNTAIGIPASGSGNIASWIAPANSTGANIVGTITVIATLNVCQGSPMCVFTVTISPSPTIFNLSGGGAYCTGVNGLNDTLSGSQVGVNYQLKKNGADYGSVVPGTGSALIWNNLTAGTYMVVATYATSLCTADMNGSVTITENALPLAGAGADQAIPFGTTTALSATASGGSGSYNFSWEPSALVVDPTSQSTNTNAMNADTYFIVTVQDANTLCANYDTMFIDVIMPLAVNAVALANDICENDTVFLNALASGGTENYTYLWSSNPPGLNADSANPIAIPLLNTTYTVTVSDGVNTATSSTSVAIFSRPEQFNLTGGGTYCQGAGGIDIILENSYSDVIYQLFQNGLPYGLPLQGIDMALTWTNIPSGTYTATATFDYTPSCDAQMLGSVIVTESPSPVVYNVTGGGVYCQGGTGISVFLSGSETGIDYQLYKNGNTIGASVSGTGNAIEWPNMFNGNYTITATYASSPYCAANMNGTVVITQTSSLVAYNLIGGGSYCAGGTGLSISLSSSQSGINYQLKNNGVDQGPVLMGTGNMLTWNNLTSGTYTVTASAPPSCVADMNGSIVITESPLPAVFNLSGGIALCSDGSDTLSGSEIGVSYQLKKNGAYTGSTVSGTGSALIWTNLTSGTYTVVATNDAFPYCMADMNGSVVITENPTATVTQIANIIACPGSLISIGNFVSDPTGATFEWTNSNIAIGLATSGSGNIASWIAPPNIVSTTVGDIIVTPMLNGCPGTPMSFTVTIYPTPMVNQMVNITACPGTTINIGDFISDPTGATFEWTNSNTAIGIAASGSGNIASWTAPPSNTGADIVGTITVRPWFNGCQGFPMTFTVTILPTPIVNQIANISVCPGSQLVIPCFTSMPSGATFTWTNTNTAIGLPVSGSVCIPSWTAPANITGTNIVSTIEVIPSLNGCQGTPMSFTVTILPTPAVNQIANISVCPGSQIVIPCFTSMPSGATFDWTNTNTAIWLPVSGIGCIPSWNAPANTTGANIVSTIMVTPNLNGCSGTPMTFTVTINPAPTVFNFTGGGAYCTGSGGLSDTLSGSQIGVNYQLKKNGADYGQLVPGTGNALIWSNLTAGTYMVVATYDGASNCLADMNGIVSIAEYPAPVAFAGLDKVVAPGGTTILIGTANGGSGAYSYLWEPELLVVNPDTQFTYTLPINNSTSFTVYVTDSLTSCSDSDAVNVFVMGGALTVSANVLPGVICIGDTVHLTSIPNGGTSMYTYFWTSDPPGFTSSLIDTFAAPTVNTTYTVTVNDGSQQASSSVSVVVTSASVGGTITGSTAICLGGSTGNLAVNGYVGSIIMWQKRLNGGVWIDIPYNGPVFSETPPAAGVWEYRVIVKNGPCEEAISVFATVTVSLNPTVFNLTGGGAYCAGSADLTDTLSGSQIGVNYQLKKNGVNEGAVVAGTGNALVWNNLTTGAYTVVATYATSPYCTADMNGSVDIIVLTPPVVNLGIDTTVCIINPITLHGPIGNNYTYTWIKLPDDTLSNANFLYIDPSIVGLGLSTYVLLVSDSNSCVGSDTINIVYDPCPFVFENINYNIRIFPNPAKGFVTIDWDKSLVDKVHVEMCDIYGRVAFNNELNSRTNKINLQGFSTGVYFIRITSGTVIYTAKLIIEK